MNLYVDRALTSIDGYQDFVDRIQREDFKITKSKVLAKILIVPAKNANLFFPSKTVIFFCSRKELVSIESQGRLACLFFEEAFRYLSRKENKKDLSYLFSGYSFCRIGLHTNLKGWTRLEVSPDDGYVDYLHLDVSVGGRKDHSLYSMKCRVKNSLMPEGLDLVCDKSQLYKNLNRFLPRTWDLNEFDPSFLKVPMIAKPTGVGAYAGASVQIVTNREELERAKTEIYSNPRWKGVISEYIESPLLFKRRKFHLRVYMLVTSRNTYSVFERSHIFTAELPYIEGDYSKQTTDTHGESTEENWEFPGDWEDERDISAIQGGIIAICDTVWNVLKGNLESYPESKQGYEVIGLDILFDSYLTPWLLEVNRKIGLEPSKSDLKYSTWCADYFDWIYSEGILVLF